MAKDVTPKWKRLQDRNASGGLAEIFIDELNWSSPGRQIDANLIEGFDGKIRLHAELKQFAVIEVITATDLTSAEQRLIDKRISVVAPERLIVFRGPSSSTWRWPSRTPAGNTTFEAIRTAPGVLPTFLAQRLTGLLFTAKDFAKKPTLGDVRDRVRGSLDSTEVTKKFFKEFQQQHVGLADSIVGIKDPVEKASYATLILNRLMLLYFFQKKEFLDSNTNYLEDALTRVQALSGRDHFYTFYRSFLLPLFFSRLATPHRENVAPEIQQILGNVPYINGGIYQPSQTEELLGEDLFVPDDAFEKILAFFGKFNWHLDTRPTGNQNEINPDVVGFIFEQYINVTTGGKKSEGAYYTREDVTGYMTNATLVPTLIEILDQNGLEVLGLISADPSKYIPESLTHGFDEQSKTWIQTPESLVGAWSAGPIAWNALDSHASDPDVCLPDESWVEVFHRRERVDKLLKDLAGGAVKNANDIVTFALDGHLLLLDIIDSIDSVELAETLWNRISTTSVLDPTCGSGAFLFAALRVLEEVYAHILDVIETLTSSSGAISEVLGAAKAHSNRRYFIRKFASLKNLYGVDIMPDAVETAKLRIFLSLAACLESAGEIEPLPDLDFNLKCGNLVLGFSSPSDVARIGGDIFAAQALERLGPQIDKYQADLSAFMSLSDGKDIEFESSKRALRVTSKSISDQCDAIFADAGGVAPGSISAWKSEFKPFHWFCEFPDVMERGGFDVIIGNPPYIQKSTLNAAQKLSWSNYQTSKCPDVYANCLERSIQLLSGRGRHAFIMPLNLSFSPGFGEARQVIADQGYAEWWSTYGVFPDGLFTGAAVRNTILILAPGEGVCSTRHHIFTSKGRQHLFSNIEYFRLPRHGKAIPNRGGVAHELADALAKRGAPVGPPNGQSVFLKPAATYWYPVLPSQVASYDKQLNVVRDPDPNLKPVHLIGRETQLMTTCVLAGKITYFWWLCTTDNFNVAAEETKAPRALLSAAVDPTGSLEAIAKQIWAQIPGAVVVINHKGYFVNIKWRMLSSATDEFDLQLLRLTNLDDHWRNLNIYYRQCMRSASESAKEVSFPEATKERLIRLPEI